MYKRLRSSDSNRKQTPLQGEKGNESSQAPAKYRSKLLLNSVLCEDYGVQGWLLSCTCTNGQGRCPAATRPGTETQWDSNGWHKASCGMFASQCSALW